MHRLFLLISILSFFKTVGQTDSLINSGEILNQAKILTDSGNYSSAIKTLRRIDPRDTNYVAALYKIADIHLTTGKFDSAILEASSGLGFKSKYKSQLMVVQGMAYSRKGDYQKALNVFDEGMKEYPFYPTLLLQKGLSLYTQKRYDEAEKLFFEGLQLSPFNTISHQYLGFIAMLRGEKTKGMMAMGIYMALNNSHNGQLVNLERFTKNEISDEGSLPSSQNNPFERLDAIIRSKLAMEEGYQTKIPIQAGIVRQYQLMFDQFLLSAYQANDPWTQVYLPLYMNMIKANTHEAFIYHILNSSTFEQVPNWTKKNESALKKFYTQINGDLQAWRKLKKLPELGYTEDVMTWYYNNGRLESIGNKINDKNSGLWHYYYENGELRAVGSYGANGKKKGTWKYYDDAGNITNIENYDTGEYQTFSNEGKLWQKYFLKNDTLDGEVFIYYPCGTVQKHFFYESGKRHGKAEIYSELGSITERFQYDRDSLTGSYLTFYPEGQKLLVCNYQGGKLHGAYTRYYKNGHVSGKGDYVNGLAQGPWKNYHANGKLKESGQYKDDLPVGEFKFYNIKGALTETKNFNDKGELHGKNDFFEKGVHAASYEYENNILKQSKSFKITGELLWESKTENGKLNGKSFYSTGEVLSEYYYENGKANGVWKYFYRSGQVLTENPYQDDKLHGIVVEYYPNGQVKSRMPYVQGERDGLYESFYINGKINSRGWYQFDKPQQRWLSYFLSGVLSSDEYYLNGDLTGASISFNLDGSQSVVIDNSTNGISDMRFYNPKGALISRTVASQSGKEIIEEINNIVYQRNNLSCGLRHGPQVFYFQNGRIFIDRNYSYGKMAGKTTRTDPFGNQEFIGFYDQGNAEGTWTWYHRNGKKETIGQFLNDERDSVWTYYHDNGQLFITSEYLDGKKHGISKLWNPDGQLLIEKKFDKGDLIAYRSPNTPSKEWINFNGHGSIQINMPNGKPGLIENYENGVLHGQQNIFYTSGNLFRETNYWYGELHGNHITYHANGRISIKLNYIIDDIVGEAQYFDTNGLLTKTITYEEGYLHGLATSYSNGKKVQQIMFSNGLPTEQ